MKRVVKDDGSVYLYAWRGRGAPRLYSPEGSDALWREWKEAFKLGSREIQGGDVTAWLLRWRQSPPFQIYQPNTQRAYELFMAKIRDRFGAADPRAFTEASMRPIVLDWRDSMAATPAMADQCVSCLQTFLAWLQDRAVIGAHVCHKIKRLSDSDRSACVWTDAHFTLFRAKAPVELVRVMDVARLTAFSAAELVRLEWTMVDVDEIAFNRQKTGELALVPVLDELRTVLAGIPRAHARVLVNSLGRPYPTAQALSQRFCVVTKEIGMPERTLHDLRRTAATEFCKAGLDDREIAEMLGWGTLEVAKIRRLYVGREAIIRSAVERLAEHRRAKAGNRAKKVA